jgi:hypothetical protein
LKDYFFPQNGERDRNGRPVRVSIAGYFKDLYHVAHALPGSAWETAKGKLHPLLTLVADILSNEDFFGTEIRNPDDPFVQQMGRAGVHVDGGAAHLGAAAERRRVFRHHEGAPKRDADAARSVPARRRQPPAHRTKEQGPGSRSSSSRRRPSARRPARSRRSRISNFSMRTGTRCRAASCVSIWPARPR